MTKRKMEISVALMIHELKSTIIELSENYPVSFDDEIQKIVGATNIYDLVWQTLKNKLYDKYKNGNKNVLWLIKEINEVDSFVEQLEKDGYDVKEVL